MDTALEILARLLVGVALAAVIGYWLKPSHATLGRRELVYGFGVKTFGLLLLGISAAATYGGFLTDGSNQRAAFGLAIFFGLTGSYWLAETLTRRISYSETALETGRFFGRTSYNWEDLEDVDYSHLNSWYVLQFEGRRKIRISEFLNGTEEFFKFLDRKLQEIDNVHDT